MLLPRTTRFVRDEEEAQWFARDPSRRREEIRAGSKLADLVKDMPDVEHPVIRTHPVTGRKAIYVREGECVGIYGMPEAESLPLIKELGELVTRAEFCYRHTWRVGDLLMWDNSMTQHLAISDYQLPLRRLMHCVTVNGTVPI